MIGNGKAEQAMQGLRDEMARNAKDPGVGALGEYFTARLQREPEIADKILAKGTDSLTLAFTAVRATAKRKSKSGYYCMSDTEAYAIACAYYGIGEEAQAPAAPEPKEPEDRQAANDALDLDALLGV